MRGNKILAAFIVCFAMFIVACSNKDPVITIYGSSQCHHCLDLKKALDSAQMTYTFYDIDASELYAREMFNKLEKANKFSINVSLPVVELNERTLLVGASFQSIQKAL